MSDPLICDYSFEFGKYKDMNEMLDNNNFRYKLNALMNLMQTRPGQVCDNPKMGIDMDKLQFSEGMEIGNMRSYIQQQIMNQANTYIEPGFVEEIEITSVPITNGEAGAGAMEVQFRMALKGEVGVVITSIKSERKLVFKTVEFDKQPFRL